MVKVCHVHAGHVDLTNVYDVKSFIDDFSFEGLVFSSPVQKVKRPRKKRTLKKLPPIVIPDVEPFRS